MHFRKKGWHLVGIPAGSSVSQEISNRKESIHWLLSLDQTDAFPNSEYGDVTVNDNSWNRLYYTDLVAKQTGLWIYYNPLYDSAELLIDQNFIDNDLSNNPYVISESKYIRLTESIELNVGQYQYFDIKSDHVTFDGDNNTITINMRDDNVLVNGLFKNGDSSDHNITGTGYSNITIKNLTINVVNGHYEDYQGVLGQYYFGKNGRNNLIENCHVSGKVVPDINGVDGGSNSYIDYFGGMIGARSCNNYYGQGQGKAVNLTLLNCSSSVCIYGRNKYCSGLVGPYAARYGGSLCIKNCFSSGSGYTYSGYYGGLLGSNSGTNNGRITIEDSYTTHNIGRYSGGLLSHTIVNPNTVSSTHRFGRVSVKNSYSLGYINVPGGTDPAETNNYQGGPLWPINNLYEPYSDAS